jgi:hypothetical protein
MNRPPAPGTEIRAEPVTQADVDDHRRRPDASWQISQIDDDVLGLASRVDGADHLDDLGMLIDGIRVASHRHVPLPIRGSTVRTVRQRTGKRFRKAFGDHRRDTGIGDQQD